MSRRLRRVGCAGGAGRASLAAVLAALLVALPAAPASATPLLLAIDAQVLSDHLQRATEAQGICYGWNISVRDESGRVQLEQGSNLGAGRMLTGAPECRRSVVLFGDVTYTSEYSEAEDTADWNVRSSLGKPTIFDVQRATGLSERDLLGDDDDRAVYNAVASLPLLVAEAGLAPAVPPATTPKPPGDQPDEEAGRSDWLRQWLPALVIFSGLLLAGIAAILWGLYSRRTSPRRTSDS